MKKEVEARESKTNRAGNKKSKWKRIFLILLFAIVGLIVVATISAQLLEDRIKKAIVEEISNQVNVPIKINGSVDLSLLKHFPNASISFNNVQIDDRIQKGNKKLLSAQEVSFLCDIFSLMKDEIEFSRVLVRNGELNLYTDETGKNNFDIIKSDTRKSKNKFSILLKNAKVKQMGFTYIHKAQSTVIDLKLKDITLKGNLGEQNFDLDSKGKLTVNRVFTNGEDFFAGKNISAEVILEVDRLKQKFNFKKGKISLEATAFNVIGFFAFAKDGIQLDFKLLNKGEDAHSLFSLFPEKYKSNFVGAYGSGRYSIRADVTGIISKSSLPKVYVNIDLQESELRISKYNKLLKNVHANAVYKLEENGNDQLVISNFNCTLNNHPFKFSLSLNKLSEPDFDFYANGVFYLSELSSFIPDSTIREIGGFITFNSFHLKGKKSDLTSVENSTLSGTGELKFSDVEFQQNGITYGNINGSIKYDNQVIEAQDFTLNFLSTDFTFRGRIENLLQFIYNLNEKRKANDTILEVNGKIKTQTFNLTGILDAYYMRKNRSQAPLKEKIDIREIFSMKGNLDVEMTQFLFRKMKFENLRTNLQVSPGQVRVNQLTAKTMSGDLRAKGLVSFTLNNSLNLKMDVSAVGMDIPDIFNQCENFGQNTLTGKHLKGTVSAVTSFDLTWKNYKVLDENALAAIVDFKITKGELLKFEPLRTASKFVRIEELEHIKFADLENTIKIAGRQIDFPEFEIRTSALNLLFYGHHSFDNVVDYHFKINLHKLLAKKYKRHTEEASYIENDPYEGVNIYLSMTGDMSNPKIKFDKSSIRKKIQNDFRNEKEVLKKLLENNLAATQSSVERKEEKHFDVHEQPQFLDFDTTSD